MLGTRGAFVWITGSLAFIAFLGVVAGGIACALLREGWDIKTMAIDAVLSVIVAFFVELLVETASRDIGNPDMWSVWPFAVLSVIGLHLLRRASRT